MGGAPSFHFTNFKNKNKLISPFYVARWLGATTVNSRIVHKFKKKRKKGHQCGSGAQGKHGDHPTPLHFFTVTEQTT